MQIISNVGGDPLSGSAETSSNAVSMSVTAGSYKVISNLLNIRALPSITANIIEQKEYGQIIDLDDWSLVTDGYVWGRFQDPTDKYVVVRSTNGGSYLQKTNK